MNASWDTTFTRQLGIQYPIICGAMYPCSNPELVAAASEAGGIGVIQPVSLVYAHGYSFKDGLRLIRNLTQKPVGMNVLVEKSSKTYTERMMKWVDESLDEGVRFFVTALGDPRWVIDKVKARGGIVYHDITERKWAEKVIRSGVDGFICVNNRAGGHAGRKTPAELVQEIKDYGLPLICAGGVSTARDVRDALSLGYAGVQMGTRFIASKECTAHDDYKRAILKATAKDIVLTERLTGVPVAIIATDYVKKVGTKAGPIAKMLLKGKKTKHWVRMWYTITSARQLKHASLQGLSYKDYFQAGKSVEGIDDVLPVQSIIANLTSEGNER